MFKRICRMKLNRIVFFVLFSTWLYGGYIVLYAYKSTLKIIDRRFAGSINDNNGYCQPVINVVFVKTHKTGGSTITNILSRYADQHNLQVILPNGMKNRFSWPNKFKSYFIDRFVLYNKSTGRLGRGNMLVNHAVYDRDEMDKCVPQNTKYITILRNPITQFESTYHYFKIQKMLRDRNFAKTLELNEFLNAPKTILESFKKNNPKEGLVNLVYNGMLFDLGAHFPAGHAEINKYILKLSNEFNLVLIMEYFDESLILLKNEFCWDFEDIFYIKQNVRVKIKKMSFRDISKIKVWNEFDFKLYTFFNNTLWEKINQNGKKFWHDLRHFRQMKNEISKSCLFIESGEYQTHDEVFIGELHVNKNSSIAANHIKLICERSVRNEVDYLKYFRRKVCKLCHIFEGNRDILKAVSNKTRTTTPALS